MEVGFWGEMGDVDGTMGGRRFGAGEDGDTVEGLFGVEDWDGFLVFCRTIRPCVFIDTGGGDFMRPMLTIDPHLSSLRFDIEPWEGRK